MLKSFSFAALFSLMLSLTLAACSDTGAADDSGGDDSGGDSDGVVNIADAPAAVVRVRIVDDSGALLENFEADDPARLSNNESSGTVSLVSQVEATLTQIQIVLWQDGQVGEWTVAPLDGMPPSSGATVTLIHDNVSGQGASGTVAITRWQRTDSPYVMLATGTFEAGPFTNEGDPSWIRGLEEGEFEGLQVTSF